MDELDQFFNTVGTDVLVEPHCFAGNECGGCELCMEYLHKRSERKLNDAPSPSGLSMPSYVGSVVMRDRDYILNIEYTLPDIGNMP